MRATPQGGDFVSTPEGRNGMIVKTQRSQKVDSLEYNIKFADNTYGWYLAKDISAPVIGDK